jgi:hypothetical protein
LDGEAIRRDGFAVDLDLVLSESRAGHKPRFSATVFRDTAGEPDGEQFST